MSSLFTAGPSVGAAGGPARAKSTALRTPPQYLWVEAPRPVREVRGIITASGLQPSPVLPLVCKSQRKLEIFSRISFYALYLMSSLSLNLSGSDAGITEYPQNPFSLLMQIE